MFKHFICNSRETINAVDRFPSPRSKYDVKEAVDYETESTKSSSSSGESHNLNKSEKNEEILEASFEHHKFTSTKTCTECGKRAKCRHTISGKARGACANSSCDAFLCKECKNNFVLIPRENTYCMNVNPYDKERANEWRHTKFQRFCRSCYMDKNIIDFNTYSHVFNPEPENDCNITLILSHGAGGSRVTFITHARELTKRHGFRTIVMDWAGHGARWEEECTIDNCMNAIQEIFKHYDIMTAEEEEQRGRKTILCGSSWGGYMCYLAATNFPEYFSGVVTDSSMRDLSRRSEKLKWSIISKMVANSSYHSQIKFLQKSWNSKRKPYMDCIEGKFGAGIFGKCCPFQTMKNFDFKDCAPEIKCPILFLNGTNDSDGYDPKCQKMVLKLLPTRDQSRIVLFHGGDHLFSHDYRFFETWIESTASFAKAETTHVI